MKLQLWLSTERSVCLFEFIKSLIPKFCFSQFHLVQVGLIFTTVCRCCCNSSQGSLGKANFFSPTCFTFVCLFLQQDILFDANTHKVKKFVLHTNYPGHYNFNMWVWRTDLFKSVLKHQERKLYTHFREVLYFCPSVFGIVGNQWGFQPSLFPCS